MLIRTGDLSMAQRRSALPSALREIVRLQLPTPWIVPTMLDLVRAMVPFSGCVWSGDFSSKEYFRRCLAGDDSHITTSAHAFHPFRDGIGLVPMSGIARFGSSDAARLEDAAKYLNAAVREARHEIPQECPLVDGRSEFLLVNQRMEVAGHTRKSAVLGRCALHFGIEEPLPSEGSPGWEQQLWEHIRFARGPQGASSFTLASHWGIFRIGITSVNVPPTGRAAVDEAPHLVVQITERVPRMLQALAALAQLRLSPREIEACRWIVEGLHKPEIAERMHVAESTVRSSIKSVYARLGIASREQLMELALEHRSAAMPGA
jgi:DNA-binding CsgD family transcriptional regulator